MIVSTEDPQGRYVRRAAPAPVENDELRDNSDEDRRLHELCEDWAYWCHTRRYLGAPKPLNINSIARWAAPMRATASVGGDGPVSAELQRLNIAICAQPMSKGRQAFILYYLNRVRPVKKIADALNVSRQHVYTLIADFRRDAARGAAALGRVEAELVSTPMATK